MSDTTKRLDLQFGSFACSVQGFDNPVQPVQQVLQALQHLLEETPELSDAGIAFDAEAIDRLIGEVARRADLEEDKIEIVPGLIIVHRGGDGAAGHIETDTEAHDGADDDGDEGWAQHFVASVADQGATYSAMAKETAEPDEEDDAGPGYVNIFNPAARSGRNAEAEWVPGLFTSAADDGPEPAWDAAPREDESFAARIGQRTTPEADIAATGSNSAADGEPPGDPGFGGDGDPADSWYDDPILGVFADPGADAGGIVFADPAAANDAAATGNDDAPVNLFAAPGRAEVGRTQAGGGLFVVEDAREAPAPQGREPERGEALFGPADGQPDPAETDDGYTAAGLAKAAGAKTVADLIVSAAAWMVLIKGRTSFSRNDVVEVFQTIPGEHAKTLEARVKGFGTAVRDGQLIRLEDGEYSLADAEIERFERLL